MTNSSTASRARISAGRRLATSRQACSAAAVSPVFKFTDAIVASTLAASSSPRPSTSFSTAASSSLPPESQRRAATWARTVSITAVFAMSAGTRASTVAASSPPADRSTSVTRAAQTCGPPSVDAASSISRADSISPLRTSTSARSSEICVGVTSVDSWSMSSRLSTPLQSRCSTGRFACCCIRSCKRGYQTCGTLASRSAGSAVAIASNSTSASSGLPAEASAAAVPARAASDVGSSLSTRRLTSSCASNSSSCAWHCPK